jgi:hypothetical protein
MTTRTTLIVAVIVLMAFAVAPSFAGEYVNGVWNNGGVYVHPYYRAAPDSSYNNNYSVYPNVNPYTGRMGTQQPTLNNKPPSSGNAFDRPW